MNGIKSFRDLKVWEKTHQLTLDVYKATKGFPDDERFGLTTQLRRACSSVPTNIVEGFKRQGKKDQAHFFNVAQSSLEETKYHLILAHDLSYLHSDIFENLMTRSEEASRMLYAYRRSTARQRSLVASANF